jgi:hypothetical protein
MDDIEKLLQQQIERERKRSEYNSRPDVVERRKFYNKFNQEKSKIARRVLSGEITSEQGSELLATAKREYEDATRSLSSRSV